MNTIVAKVNALGASFIDHAGAMLVQSSLLVVLVLALDLCLRRRVRAGIRYWIWTLVLVKLMLPTTLSSPVSLGAWLGEHIDLEQVFVVDAFQQEGVPTGVELASTEPLGPAETGLQGV
jgi:hypothetical protein